VCNDDNCIPKLTIEDLKEPEPVEQSVVREVTFDDEAKVRQLLKDLHDVTCSSHLNVPSGIFSGLTLDIINGIINSLKFIDSTQYLLDNFDILDESFAENVFGIIKGIFREPFSPQRRKSS